MRLSLGRGRSIALVVAQGGVARRRRRGRIAFHPKAIGGTLGDVPGDWTDHSLHLPRVAPAASRAALELHLAAVEYALANPITIRDRDDIQSARHWSEHLEPFEHQVRNLITFCRRAPVALIADEVGLGKTISAGLIISELMVRKRVRRALVVCPKILLPQWQEELRSKFKMRARYETGANVRHLVHGSLPVVLTTYETARNHMETLREGSFDFLVLDEAHKLRNLHGPGNTPRTATVFREALAQRAFPYVLMLTATPIQNRLWDLYSLVDCLTAASQHDNPFGPPSQFTTEFLADSATEAQRLRPRMKTEFRRRLSNYLVRTSRRESGLLFPERRTTTVGCPQGEVEARMQALVANVLPRLNGLSQVSLAVAMMSSPAALASQLENMARNGSVPPSVAQQARALATESPTGTKMERLRALVSDLRASVGSEWRMVVFTGRKETQAAIGRDLAQHGARVAYVGGGSGATANAAAISAFWAEPPGANVIVSTDAGAEGVNLQVCNVVVNYDLPWNPMIVEQRIGRVQRLASRFQHVSVANLVVADSVEERVVARLMVKLQAVSDTLGDVEAILEAAGRDDEDSIQNELRDLVVKSLMGQDVEAATRAVEATIERAKALYDEERATVEDTLGAMDEMHRTGPRLPDLAPVAPRFDVPTFVRLAHEENGATVTEDDRGRLRIAAPGHAVVLATFDETDPDLVRVNSTSGFGGKWIQYYAPGSRAFEQLVGEWASRRVHRVRDGRDGAATSSRALIDAWLRSIDEELRLESVRVEGRVPRFRGRATFQASAAVAVDRLERLVDVTVGDGQTSLTDVPEEVTYVRDELYLPEYTDHDADALRRTIAEAPDLTAFAAFYDARLTEDLRRTTDDRMKAALRDRFEPFFAAELQALDGDLVEQVDVAATVSVAGDGEYAARFRLDAGAVVETPDVGVCHLTGKRVPASALAECAMGGEAAIAHLLMRSDLSGRAGLPERARTCSVTGRTLLEDEVLTSAVSGRVAGADLFARCAITGDDAIRTELEACGATGATVRPDLLVQSDVSELRVRGDEVVASARDGRCGHVTEMMRCDVSGAWMAPDEAGTSDVSGRIVLSSLLVPSMKDPNRRGAPDEAVECAVSGRTLLSDEYARSALSGEPADPDLLVASEESGRLGLPSELERCAETNARLLRDELGVCAETGQLVRQDLLLTNDFTAQQMLGRVLRSCPETGKRGRERDLVRCEITDVLVAAEATAVCTETNARGLLKLMVRCDECGAPLLAEKATRTARAEAAHRVHTAKCSWTGETHLLGGLGLCTKTGVRVRVDLLDGSGVARVLVDLRRDADAKVMGDADLSDVVQAALPKGIKVRRVWGRSSPDAAKVAFVAERRSGFLGLGRAYVQGFVDRRSGDIFGELGTG